jgi:hypothetical protein
VHARRGISEDNKHDADAVLEFEKQALDIVSKDIRIQIKEIHQWTDGCAAQYKGNVFTLVSGRSLLIPLTNINCRFETVFSSPSV